MISAATGFASQRRTGRAGAGSFAAAAFLATAATLLSSVAVCHAATSTLSYRIDPVAAPGDAIVVHLSLTSNRAEIAAVGGRLAYDAARVAFESVETDSGIPASWGLVYQDSPGPGAVDVVTMDITPQAKTITAADPVDVVKLTFSRVDLDPAPIDFGFSAAAPVSPPQIAAFPHNQYVILAGPTVTVEEALTAPASGPEILTGVPTFIRGDTNSDGSLDISDGIKILLYLFIGSSIGCEKSADADDSGTLVITDAVYVLNHLFLGGPPVPAPFPACGPDPTGDSLTCEVPCTTG